MKKLTQVLNERVEVGVQNLNSELLFITEGGNQVGSLVLVYSENKASIFSVEVLSKFRGKGYGKKLVENAVSRCRERNCSSIELNTETDNQVANGLYQSMGFEIRGIKDDFNNYVKSL